MNKSLKILVSEKIIFPPRDYLKENNISLIKKFDLDNNQLLEQIIKKQIKILIIRSVRKIDKDFLARCGLEIIATASKGTNHMDVDFASKMNIKIINSETGNTNAAAEHTIGMIIALSKKFCLSESLIRQGKFDTYDFRRNTLEGKKIGIIGFGKVGSRVGELAKAFGMEVLANDINPQVPKMFKNYTFYNLDFLLKNSDIITVHIPLNKSNLRFINRNKLVLLKKNVIFINTSRGEIIDENYLIEFLHKNPDIYAGIDVFCDEPDISESWLKLNNVLLTNHTAGKTEESNKKISDEIFRQIIARILKNISG